MSILNKNFIKEFITNNKIIKEDINKKEYEASIPVPFRWTHGATDYHLGDGLLIYSIVQFMMAKVCLCIGSGGGFIPRIITQARLDLWNQNIFEGSNDLNWGDIGVTYVVDANNGIGGSPDWLEEDSFYRRNFYPRLIVDTSENAYYNFFIKEDIKLDYIHIDGDHSYEGVKRDFELYSKILSPNGIISIHDTDKRYEKEHIVTEDAKKDYFPFDGPSKFIQELGNEWQRFDFFNLGIQRNKPASTGLTLIKHA